MFNQTSNYAKSLFFLLYIGLCTASIALFTELYIVIEMISIGTLMVFYLVANATIYRRYVMVSKHPPSRVLFFLLLLSCSAIGFSLSWKLNQQQWWSLSFFGVSTISIVSLFHYKVSSYHSTEEWSVPFMPWPAATSIFLNVFLMTTLKKLSFQRFAIWSCLISLFYVVYGVHSTYKAEEMESMNNNNNNSRVGEVTNNHQQSKMDIQVLSWKLTFFSPKNLLILFFSFIFLPYDLYIGLGIWGSF